MPDVKGSNQEKSDPDVARAMKPRVRVGREWFLTERSEGPTVHPCTGKNVRASMREPLTSLISQPPPPQRGPQIKSRSKGKINNRSNSDSPRARVLRPAAYTIAFFLRLNPACNGLNIEPALVVGRTFGSIVPRCWIA